MKNYLIGVVLLVVVAAPVQAGETRYVSDTLVITLRAGMGDEYKILRTLPSGTAMELLEAQGPFGRVRLKNGTEGWVRLQYLVKSPVARDQLAQARQRLERLEKESQRLKSEVKSLTLRNEELAQLSSKFERDNLSLSQENDKLQSLAARPLALDRENKHLAAENARLGAEIKQVSAENSELRNSTVQKWFMAGGGVLIGGILLGFFLPRLGRRKSSSW